MPSPSGPHAGDGDDGPAPASSPEDARKEAEEALSRIEELADLDADAAPEEELGAEADPDAVEQETTASEAAPDSIDAAEPASPGDGAPEDQCENCGALLHGPYCSQCGQKAADRIVPIWHMINEALEAVVELDLRVLYTMPKFLFLPGRLTKEYLNGREDAQERIQDFVIDDVEKQTNAEGESVSVTAIARDEDGDVLKRYPIQRSSEAMDSPDAEPIEQARPKATWK